MIIPIPTGVSYKTTLVGSTFKPVLCEHCQCEFVYLVRRRAVGQSSSPMFADVQGAKARAQESAEHQLSAALAAGDEIVACPNCGRYQAAMVSKAKHKLLITLGAAGSVLVVFHCALWGLNTPVFGKLSDVWWGMPGLVVLVVLSVLAIAWAYFRDMNAGAESRKKSRPGKVMLRSTFEEWLAAAQAKADGARE